MKKIIVFGSLLTAFILLAMPSISATQSDIEAKTIRQDIRHMFHDGCLLPLAVLLLLIASGLLVAESIIFAGHPMLKSISMLGTAAMLAIVLQILAHIVSNQNNTATT